MVKTNGHKLRRTVFWIVLLGGVGLLAFLFLYYSGYRFDWRQGRLIQLGSISIDVLPENSIVFLNAEQLPKTTPAIFNSIRPGEYTLRIEHEGYAPLEFPITVQSKSATVVNRTFLPPLSEPAAIPQPELTKKIVTSDQLKAVQTNLDWPIWNISGSNPVSVVSGPQRSLYTVFEDETTEIEENVSDIDTNPELHQLVYSTTGTAWMVYTNFKPFKTFILSRQSIPFTDVLLVPNMQAVILTDKQKIQLIEIGPQESVTIFQLASGNNLHLTQFDETEKVLYFQDEDQWYQLELFK